MVLDLHGYGTCPVHRGGPIGLPAVGPRLGIDSQKIGLAPVIDLHQEEVADKDWRSSHAPAVAERTVLVGEGSDPDGLAVEIERGQLARAEEHVNSLAVGC